MKPKPKRNKQKDILFILISSFIVVVLWIGFNIYHIWVTSTISEDIQVKLTPISSSFDIATLQELKSRIQVSPAYERQGAAKADSPTPNPIVTVSPAASNSARFAAPDTAVSRQGQ